MNRTIAVAVITANPAYRALIQDLFLRPDIVEAATETAAAARIVLDFPTTWAFAKLETLDSVSRARTLVVVNSPLGPYSDVVGSYHVSGVVTVGDHNALTSGVLAAASALRTYRWQSGLTYMELRVTRLLLQGRDTTEAASALRIMPKTINAHVSNALTKLGFDTRSQFIASLLTQTE